MTPFLTFALAGLSLAANPAAEPKAASSAARVDQPAAAQPNPQRRYCFKYEITGSILPQKSCKTYAEWMKDGVDPTAKQ